MQRKHIFCTVALIGALVLGVTAPGSQVEACLNGVGLSTNFEIQRLNKAQKMLQAGDFAKARKTAALSLGRARTEENHTGVEGLSPLKRRAKRIIAVADVRIAAELQRQGSTLEGRKNAKTRKRLKRALAFLGKLRKQQKEPNYALDSEWAEARAASGDDVEETRVFLEDLAKKGVLNTAYGWRALATLRRDAQDGMGMIDALERCKKMTRDKRMCVLPGPKT